MTTPMPENLIPENTYQIIFEASGTVAKGDGPDALDVPEQETDES